MSDKKKVTDSRWYGGTPLWVLAENQKMLSASFYWVASEAPIKNTLPSYYYTYNESIPMNKRLSVIRDWLTLPAARRPHFITFYFPQVDHEGHYFGPDSPETAKAVKLIDDAIGKMTAITDSLHLPVNFIFVSDHGMIRSDTSAMIQLPSVLKDTSVCRWTGGATMVMVYARDKTDKNALLTELKKASNGACDVFLSDATPDSWHFSKRDDRFNRIGDIIMTTRAPSIFQIGKRGTYPGKHGYDPRTVTEMRATFIAWGPQIKKSETIGPFENVNVFPLVTAILGLQYADRVDGDIKILKPILK